ncbi:glutamate synthase large subunit [Salimicrobium salexigens]|uniref:Glutamate synthase (NADH) large subunit n=1 Tax=Salimicrobium salexigens TaxID=908941 RepID=A0ABY1KNX6_9BACI|nr:glutamate synthase large subunit [Salimicrobium salexigens]SIS44431.1 glutamate synthase (NADH) large subunit [Salimicrobium salexigens]
MEKRGYPAAQGLYHPDFEHEACGIGMIANINGSKSHDIVNNAVTILCNLEHRGGQGADVSTGDGAGIMTQIPHSFFEKQCEKEDIYLPEAGKYGVGMVFLPRDRNSRQEAKKIFEGLVEKEGQKFLGWRSVPINASFVGDNAKTTMPYISQLFIEPDDTIESRIEFERKLYVIRKQALKALEKNDKFKEFYMCSLSTTTIVYKGMLIPEQLDSFYIDLNHPTFKTAFAMVHSRFSTNTFPSWKRSHPNRYTIHNGEFNTLRGNVNWMRAREKMSQSEAFNDEELKKALPVIDEDGSDSSMFDNALEFMYLSGRSLAHSAMMMIPEPWANDETIHPKKRDFYEYHSTLMEPWDGPAAVCYTDGRQIGACLDRNGLRPARYYVTKDGMIVLGSEVGALDIFADDIEYKGRLHPGKMLLVDLEEGRIIPDEEIKLGIAEEEPYGKWLKENKYDLSDFPELEADAPQITGDDLISWQLAFGYTTEELNKIIKPLVLDRKDPVGSMGYDSPLAVLSKKPQLLYNYFKQLFAQVTNPAIDAIREKVITMTETTIGKEGSVVNPKPESCRHLKLDTPVLTNEQLWKIENQNIEGFESGKLSLLFEKDGRDREMEKALERLFKEADKEVEKGTTFLILSDRGVNRDYVAIPALLAVSGLHHHLIREGVRTKVSLILESAEPREVHHFATLLGYGAEAVNPYLSYETLRDLVARGEIPDRSYDRSVLDYVSSVTDGIVKVLSKIGISTIQSYRGAQIFEAAGISSDVIDKYFTRTASRLGGIGLETIEQEVRMRHDRGFEAERLQSKMLDPGDEFQYRMNGEDHQYNPQTIHTLQRAARTNDYKLFKKYTKMLTDETNNLQSLRGLIKFKDRASVPLDEVEPVEEIVKRFKTGAISYGSISQEAHEALAVAMNKLGGRSNTGEGGESPDRFLPDKDGISRRSAIKQVASGRFGVTSHYLVNADEIQIKVSQGAKPGEGGHLPGKKVYPWIAEVRGATPGVELISPPPHHDIYSIEDLAELIHNLKNANPEARISVKLVSAVGVGTIAAGVAKGRADLVLISGYDGGTGAAPRTSIKHAGMPWEIGVAETHQTLLLDGLRDRITVETDGKLMTGRDVVTAALLGAEEYGFSTAPLVVLGCIMMRVCHLDTCPVGVATQNPELRKKFIGDADHVANFMRFIAEEAREIMAELGFRTVNEMIGRNDVLERKADVDHWKAKDVDLSALLYRPETGSNVGHYSQVEQDHGLEKSLDVQELIPLCKEAIDNGTPVKGTGSIRNIHRVAGTILGSEISKKYGEEGLPEDTIQLKFKGSAGQSFGAFIPRGLTMRLVGDANDYVGKGLSGGKIIVHPSPRSTFKAEDNIIAGNVCFYGASGGEAYISGKAGERFAVRNSGAHLVVEGVGDHGCEYMTGGRVAVLGETGRNFAAGMSGGIAYVLDEDGSFSTKLNKELVLSEQIQEETEKQELYEMIEAHAGYTRSEKGQRILDNWEETLPKFKRVVPVAFLEMRSRIETFRNEGNDKFEAEMKAFEASQKKEEEQLENKQEEAKDGETDRVYGV